MHFDDRLATVLNQRAAGGTMARTHYRQLLDLLGTLPEDARGGQIDAAYLRLAALSDTIPAPDRAAMLGETALRLRAPRLVAALALAEPAVAAAVVTRADLNEAQWLDLIPALPVRTRGLVRHRGDLGEEVEALLARLGIGDRGLPPGPASEPAVAPESFPAAPAQSDARPEAPQEGQIGAIVRRIEAFRKTRAAEHDLQGQALLPPGEIEGAAPPRMLETFDLKTDVEGRIVWADPVAAPAAVGLRLAARSADSPVQAPPALGWAFRHRQPVTDAALTIAGAATVAGEWRLDAAPCFDQPGGRFSGYLGRLRRSAPDLAPNAETDSEGDRMRQILHELRTPVNAIQGFAEVVQQQLYGPTPHEYRALAAAIAGDAARVLAGFEELDRLVKLDSGAMTLEPGACDLAPILSATIARLAAYSGPRRSGFTLDGGDAALPVAFAQEEAQRLLWRLLATLAGAAAPGEVLRLRARRRADGVRLTMRLPAALSYLDDDALFHAGPGAQPQALAAGMFGTGFALRLAAAEARAGRGRLERRAEKLRLTLPFGGTAPTDIAARDGPTRFAGGAR